MSFLEIILYSLLYLSIGSIIYAIPTYIGKQLIKDFRQNKTNLYYLGEFLMGLFFFTIGLITLINDGYDQILAGITLYFSVLFISIRLFQYLKDTPTS